MSQCRIHFQGWFQCRLAVNPDPSDERRGVSGYTFAVAGEPDLDRIIRWQNPVAPRSHAPPIGVMVFQVERDGSEEPQHPLVGAAVDLLGEPRFESRNRLLSEDRSGVALIEPFEMLIAGGTIEIQRQDWLAPADREVPFHRLPPAALNRRGPVRRDGMVFDPLRVAELTGIRDPLAYRRQRLAALQADLVETTDRLQRAGLEKRIRELSCTDPHDQRNVALSLTQVRRFELNGSSQFRDPARLLGGAPDPNRDWPLELWMGAWDADGLCGFVRGALTLPWLFS